VIERLPITVTNRCEVCLDVVILIDTSTGLSGVAQALCDAIAPVTASLEADGIMLRTTILGIFEDQSTDLEYPCVPDSVKDALGVAVPGAGLELLDDDEDWGPAVAILSDRFAWTSGAGRIIVAIVDEPPQNGDKRDIGGSDICDLSDVAAIDNAIAQAQGDDVIVSTILVRHELLGPGVFLPPDECVQDHAERLTTATGGTMPLPLVDDVPAAGSVPAILEAILRDAADCP
jgi:hypothetical protein